VLFWYLLARDQDYAYARPAMTRNKIRHLELLAGAPPQKGRKGVAGGKSKAVFDAERALSRQAEIAYHRLVSDWRANGPAKAGAGATPGRASPRPTKGQAARLSRSPSNNGEGKHVREPVQRNHSPITEWISLTERNLTMLGIYRIHIQVADYDEPDIALVYAANEDDAWRLLLESYDGDGERQEELNDSEAAGAVTIYGPWALPDEPGVL
jgi:hypothetical protein